MKTVSSCLIAVSIALCANPLQAQTGPKRSQPALNEAQLRMAAASQRFRRVVVELKDGSTVSGLITSVSENDFAVTHVSELSGPGDIETIRYSNVAAIRKRSTPVAVLKKIGLGGMLLPAAVLSVPVCQISILLRHPVLCPCSSGLP